nr:isoform 2 of putative fbd-associated f-box protein [Quercus suber]
MSESKIHSPQKDKDKDAVFDRISDLQDCLLCHILSFLPTKDSIATGILSNGWKLLWTLVPKLDLDKMEELDLGIEGKSKVWTLPNSVFYCKTLVVLKIRGTIEIDPPSSFQLPSLKIITLNLRLRLKYGVCELFKLLSGCPVLEDLSFDVEEFKSKIWVPTLILEIRITNLR